MSQPRRRARLTLRAPFSIVFVVNIEQVCTFLAVTANGSFLEAATGLHVTQPTVSASITVGARIALWEGFLPTCGALLCD